MGDTVLLDGVQYDIQARLPRWSWLSWLWGCVARLERWAADTQHAKNFPYRQVLIEDIERVVSAGGGW